MNRVIILIGFVLIAGAVQEISSTRVKRGLDVEGLLCAYGCISDYYNSSVFSGIQNNAGSELCKHVELAQVDGICTMYHEGKDCLKKDCSGKPLVDMLMQISSYGCDEHYQEFQSFTPCFTQSCTYIENSCKTQCGSIMSAITYTAEQKERLEQIKRLSNAQHGGSDASASDEDENPLADELPDGMDILQSLNLDGACQYFNCYLNCSQKPLTEKCGVDTYNFLKKAVLDITPMIFHGFFPNTTLPNSCQSLTGMMKPNDEDTTSPEHVLQSVTENPKPVAQSDQGPGSAGNVAQGYSSWMTITVITAVLLIGF